MKRLKAMDKERNISDLPRPILHHILSSLSQKDAVKTCVLSKSWRFLWYGRPSLESRKDRFRGTVQEFIFALHQILIRYTNQKLSIQQFILKMPTIDPVSARFLQKWIPIIVKRNKGIETFHLSFHLPKFFHLSSVVFKSECLREIYLEGCKLNQIDKVVFSHLRTLRLRGVKFEEETFERIMSSCPLIQEVYLNKCPGLKTVTVNNHNCSLKNFEFRNVWCQDTKIEITDVSTIETIHINCCLDWLELGYCLGVLEEFQLSSPSIKRLAIELANTKVIIINAPNILKFECEGLDFPSHISFTTTSNKWKSNLVWKTDLDQESMALSLWLQKLDEILKVFSHSETFVHIRVQRSDDDWHFLGDAHSPTEEVVKHLDLCLGRLCSDFSVWLEVEGEPTVKWDS